MTNPDSAPSQTSDPDKNAAKKRTSVFLNFTLRAFDILTFPLKWFLGLFLFKVSSDGNQIKFMSLHGLYFSFPFLLLDLINSAGWIPEDQLGEWFFWCTVGVLVIAFTDLSFAKSFILVAVVGFFLMISERQGWFEIAKFANWLLGNEMESVPGMTKRFGKLTLLVLVFFVIPYSIGCCRYTLSPRFFLRHRLFFGTTTARIGKNPSVTATDIFEFILLCCGGNITPSSGSSGAVKHVPFLFLFRNRVNDILQRYAIAHEDADEEETF